MAQMWLLWLPKCISTTTSKIASANNTASTVSPAAATAAASTTMVDDNGQHCRCGGLTKVIKKLKRQGRMIRAATASRQSSFQCGYDPLSYSLNFDTSGCGSMMDDRDY
ncbi:uncharacterized protein LOC8289504 [Ricinus communis]|uniref:Secreted protein n=1 Tax=Ricinus communis TaxID=3988 RepID=B9SCD8_RICCO|nr:uncharacterized protein LOC8289504 [Ricinus communis]EEF38743.1 conserved hypothetical protein [Ricinus communis]|eukprot:XP_002523657.1 uncharacterized protein LOC8289504 [Ricinus communis]